MSDNTKKPQKKVSELEQQEELFSESTDKRANSSAYSEDKGSIPEVSLDDDIPEQLPDLEEPAVEFFFPESQEPDKKNSKPALEPGEGQENGQEIKEDDKETASTVTETVETLPLGSSPDEGSSPAQSPQPWSAWTETGPGWERSQFEESKQLQDDILLTQGWNIAEHTSYPDFVLDLESGLYLFSGNVVAQDVDIDKYNKHLLYFVDYYLAPEMGILTIDGQPKYAHILARKKLQEQGELTDEYELHFVTRRKISKSRTEFLYQLLPREKHYNLLDKATKTRQGYLLFDTLGLLYGLFLGLKRKKAVALALHIPEAILLLAGRRGRVFWARRYALAGDDEHALQEGIFACVQDLLTQSGGEDIEQIEWLEGLADNPVWPQILPQGVSFYRWPLYILELDGRKVWSSLPGAVRHVSKKACFGPKNEIWALGLEKIEKWVWAAMLGLSLSFGASAILFDKTNKQVELEISQLEQQAQELVKDIKELQEPLQKLQRYSKEDLSRLRELAQNIKDATLSPKLIEIWNGLAKLKPRVCRIEALEIKYIKDGVQVRLEGTIDADLIQAQSVFTKYLAMLEEAGYKILRKDIDLSLENNFFALTLLHSL
ncbi:hypothetical protein KFV02_09400 [Desulfohalobiaceae bacterium Ax17]|uniref:hypothetical protein n=1 Tax=Desulfovulcanus ferrireducens TaxID=2831190 RepID=UPI00207B9B2E|nr:hypothetical protein [Desulfovulcanus ferrireducens]MBT8764146.1 hypothetical protein [Desulfovulcanus ferrireducens]